MHKKALTFPPKVSIIIIPYSNGNIRRKDVLLVSPKNQQDVFLYLFLMTNHLPKNTYSCPSIAVHFVRIIRPVKYTVILQTPKNDKRLNLGFFSKCFYTGPCCTVICAYEFTIKFGGYQNITSKQIRVNFCFIIN